MFDQLIDGCPQGIGVVVANAAGDVQELDARVLRAGERGRRAADGGRGAQRRWLELGVEMLNKHRETLDAAYKSGIELIEQTFHVAEAKSTDDYRHMIEELWRKLFDLPEGAVREPVPRLPDLVREVGRAGSRDAPRLASSGSTGAPRRRAVGWRQLDAETTVARRLLATTARDAQPLARGHAAARADYHADRRRSSR